MITAALTGIIAIIVLAFSWPAVTAEPKDVATAVVGPEQAATAIAPAMAEQLQEQGDGVFDIAVVDDREAAVDGIEQRDCYGAIVLDEQPELLRASADGTINQVVA